MQQGPKYGAVACRDAVTAVTEENHKGQPSPCPTITILNWPLSSDPSSKGRGLLSNYSVNLTNVENQIRLCTF